MASPLFPCTPFADVESAAVPAGVLSSPQPIRQWMSLADGYVPGEPVAAFSDDSEEEEGEGEGQSSGSASSSTSEEAHQVEQATPQADSGGSLETRLVGCVCVCVCACVCVVHCLLPAQLYVLWEVSLRCYIITSTLSHGVILLCVC